MLLLNKTFFIDQKQNVCPIAWCLEGKRFLIIQNLVTINAGIRFLSSDYETHLNIVESEAKFTKSIPKWKITRVAVK